MDRCLMKCLAETMKRIRDNIKINGPAISEALMNTFGAFEKRLDNLKPQMMESIKLLVPYFEALPRIIDGAVCAELSLVCFVMPEKPDQDFLNGLVEASKESETVFVSDDEVEEILSPEAIDKAILSYLENTNFRMTKKAISIIEEELMVDPLWKQSLDAYRRDDYALSILGFAALTDRLLSKYSGMDDTGIKIRVNQLIERAKDRQLDDQEAAEVFLINTYEHCADVYGLACRFNDNEPAMLNRHWLMHGRRTIPVTKLDCVKLLHILYGTIATGRMCDSEINEEESTDPKVALQKLMKSAVRSFNKYEKYLIDNNASERCLCGRLAYHLQRSTLNSELYKDYVVDIEYNIGMDGTPDGRKKVFGANAFLDIVAHIRKYNSVTGFDNLIAIEMKKQGRDFEEDKKRLQCLTNSIDSFGYKAGFAIKVDYRNHRLLIDEEYYFPSDCGEITQ